MRVFLGLFFSALAERVSSASLSGEVSPEIDAEQEAGIEGCSDLLSANQKRFASEDGRRYFRTQGCHKIVWLARRPLPLHMAVACCDLYHDQSSDCRRDVVLGIETFSALQNKVSCLMECPVPHILRAVTIILRLYAGGDGSHWRYYADSLWGPDHTVHSEILFGRYALLCCKWSSVHHGFQCQVSSAGMYNIFISRG